MSEETVTRDLVERIRRLSRPCDPEPTGHATRLGPLPGIQAVIFDIYGTLLVSGTGDIGPAGDYEDEQALHAAFSAVGVPAVAIAQDVRVTELLVRYIHIAQDERRRQGIEFPEVDILRVWEAVLQDLKSTGASNASSERPRGLLGRRALQRLLSVYPRDADGSYVATYEVVYGHAWGSEAGKRMVNVTFDSGSPGDASAAP